MEKDFKGSETLLKNYYEITKDLSQVYRNGLAICFAGTHGTGKQLCLETELPTPDGFIKLKDLKEGDTLFDEQGNPCKVTKLHSVNISPESYEIEFDDGTKVKACADHQWLTWTDTDRQFLHNNSNKSRSPKIKNTKEILETLKSRIKNPKSNHSIPCSLPINYDNKNIKIDPYLLGIWLGDGTSREGNIVCTNEDYEIINNIERAGYEVIKNKSLQNHNDDLNYKVPENKECYRYRIGKIMRGSGGPSELTLQLKEYSLINNKHIPDDYLYSSFENRLSLLQGLMDSDGSISKDGRARFSTTIKILSDQVHQLILSLGIKCNVFISFQKNAKDQYHLNFITQLPIFRLKRKLDNIKINKNFSYKTKHRYITNIKPIDSIPMRCITVDSPSHLFLITRSFIPTHNTMTSTSILKKACHKNYACLYTTLSDMVAILTLADSTDKFASRKELMVIDFLIIDEFDPRFMPSENASDLFGRTLESVFRTRSQNKLPTIMCTNSPNVIESFTGPIKQSIESLMKGYVKIIPVIGTDFRKTKKSV